MPNHNLNQGLPIKTSVRLDCAESHMVSEVLLVAPSDRVRDVQERLIAGVKNFETINYIYAVNKSNKLVGALSIQELFAAKSLDYIADVMVKKVITVRQSTHNEKVALLALKHNLKAIPVIDKKGIFKGVVPSDAILTILSNAHLEDLLLSAGIYSSDSPMRSITETSVNYHLKKRFPWLIIGLAGSMVTTFIVGSFDEMLEAQILLASFIPAIVYMADAVGNQTQTIFIKAMAINSRTNLLYYFLREIKISLFLGMVLSTIVFIISSFAWKLPIISFIFAFSLLAAVVGSSILAILLPVTLKKINIDPAVASGPLASVLRDAYSLSIYLIFANLLLNIFG